jgi:hypothetical protein
MPNWICDLRFAIYDFSTNTMHDGVVLGFCMTAIEKHILESLIDLDRAVKSLRTATPKPDLQAIFARLEQLTDSLPPQSDPNLLHYLHKKSYEKARLFLEGRDAENARGGCHRD